MGEHEWMEGNLNRKRAEQMIQTIHHRLDIFSKLPLTSFPPIILVLAPSPRNRLAHTNVKRLAYKKTLTKDNIVAS